MMSPRLGSTTARQPASWCSSPALAIGAPATASRPGGRRSWIRCIAGVRMLAATPRPASSTSWPPAITTTSWAGKGAAPTRLIGLPGARSAPSGGSAATSRSPAEPRSTRA